MADSSDVQAIEKIASVVHGSQVTYILTSHSIKAQGVLHNKLIKQIERYKEICNSIHSANLKLDYEIKNAEQEVKSLLGAQDAINTANVDLRKELLRVQENKLDIIEKIENRKIHNEKLRLTCKTRYESLPFVKKLIDTENRAQLIRNEIRELDIKAQELKQEICAKKRANAAKDKQHVVELAKFLQLEMPSDLKLIEAKTVKNTELVKEIELLKEKLNNKKATIHKPVNILHQKVDKNDTSVINSITINSNNDDTTPLIPKLQIRNTDLDSISVRLNQIKKMDFTDNFANKEFTVRTSQKNTLDISAKENKGDDFYSAYFSKPVVYGVANKTNDFEKRKLINILEDVVLDRDQTFSLMSKINLEKLCSVVDIAPDFNHSKQARSVEIKEIEEIDLTDNDNIILPPTPFVNQSQNRDDLNQPPNDQNVIMESMPISEVSQEKRKSVSFDISTQIEMKEVDDLKNGDGIEGKINEGDVQETVNHETNENDDGPTDNSDRFKEIMLRQKMNLSPIFVYTKKTNTDDSGITTSKFFKRNYQTALDNDVIMEKPNDDEKNTESVSNRNVNQQLNELIPKSNPKKCTETDIIAMEIDEPANVSETKKVAKPVSGLLFSHDTQGILNSLDVSNSTTGFEDYEADYAHCIDSSLLLSPKADITVNSGNITVLSQDVPNFLSGLKKATFSFFGATDMQAKPGPSTQNSDNAFSFAFGSEEKKNRGGLFQMFK